MILSDWPETETKVCRVFRKEFGFSPFSFRFFFLLLLLLLLQREEREEKYKRILMDERSPFDFPLLFFLRSPLPFHLIISVLDKKPPPPAQLKGHKGKKIVITPRAQSVRFESRKISPEMRFLGHLCRFCVSRCKIASRTR